MDIDKNLPKTSKCATSKLGILILGFPGSGKTTASLYLSAFGFHVVSAGDVIREQYGRRDQQVSRSELIDYGQRLLIEKGFDYFSHLLLDKAEGNEKVVFDGVRPPEVVELLQCKIPKMIIIYVEAPEEVRIQRLLRAKGEKECNYRMIMESSLERSVERMKSKADYIILNSTSLNEYYKNLRNIVLPLL